MMDKAYDVAIIGAGIAGLSHAWMAAERGLKVLLLERSNVAQGASVRNFGMIWPIGQPAGVQRDLAMHSRSIWLSLAERSNVWVNPCGSLHVAHRGDELEVLEEFVTQSPMSDIEVELLTPQEALKKSPAINPVGLRGAMWSPSELCVHPTLAIAELTRWVQSNRSVNFQANTQICCIEDHVLRSSDGARWEADRILICSGFDFQTLLPNYFSAQPLRICKLQMMRTLSQPSSWELGTNLASGLTLRHYASFANCKAIDALKRRISIETPELDQLGIHVMMSQNSAGEVVLGDSHQYDDSMPIFDDSKIDELIIRELQRQFVLPSWNIVNRWHGVYAKHRELPVLEAEPNPRIHVCVAFGGAGMTLAFGLADRFWTKLTDRSLSWLTNPWSSECASN